MNMNTQTAADKINPILAKMDLPINRKDAGRQDTVRGATYNLRTIYQLDLQDSPCLMVMVEGRLYPVQDSHVTIDELLSVPGLADTEWAYRYTTEEWIPVFDSCSGQTAFFFDIQRCTEIDAYHIDPSRPIVDLDGHELTEHVVLQSGGYYADNDGEYEFGIAVEPGTSIEQAVLHVLNNPLEFAIPSTSRFVGWCSRPTTSNMTMVQL